MLNVSTLSSPYFLRQSSRELCVGENETVESGRLKTEERCALHSTGAKSWGGRSGGGERPALTSERRDGGRRQVTPDTSL